MIPLQSDKSTRQHFSRAPSPVPSAVLQNDLVSHKSQPFPKLPLPQSNSGRRSSFSHHDASEEKPLTTHKSFPHLTSSKRPLYPNQRRGSDILTDDSLSNSTETISLPNIRYASDKRNHDFHNLFRSVPGNERLIDDYGCALQKEILLQGRIYISEHHLCFNANIFGWITNLVIAFEDIRDIGKKTTAIFIPNAILISTCTSKHFFASFLSRDQAFDQMVDLWRISRASNNPSRIEPECVTIHSNEDESDYSSSDYSYSEDEEDDDHLETLNTIQSSHIQDKQSQLQTSLASLPLPKHVTDENARRRTVSEAGQRPNLTKAIKSIPETTVASNYDETVSRSLASLSSSLDSNTDEKSQLKNKTQCECHKNDQHFPTVVMDAVYDTSIKTMYSLLFNSAFMTKFLGEVEKSTDIRIGKWFKSDECVRSRESSYTKHLNNSIGPKSTKCFLKEEILHLDTTNYISQLTVTNTPDVPAGSAFTVKTKTCISWSGQGQVRMLVTVLVDFTKSSWLKSTIEKATIDGQQTFYKNLDAAIRKFLHAQVPRTVHKSSARRRKRRASSKKRQRHHVENAQPVTSVDKGQPVIHTLSDLIAWTIKHLGTLTLSQITMFCMIMMVTTNLYIASRIAGLDSQLSHLHHRPTPTLDHGDTLWKLLGTFDSNTQSHTYRLQTQDESNSSDEHLAYSKSTKQALDKKIGELEKMILRAGYNVNHVTQMIQDQKKF